MGAPAGNEFWKLRSKHGRDKIFASPEVLREAAYEYFQHQNERLWVKNEAIKGGEFAGQLIEVPTATPFTIEGLCIFLGVNKRYFNDFDDGIKGKGAGITQTDKDFSDVIAHIREVIYQQKFEGAAVGAFNANIIARDLGLRDGIDATSNGETITPSATVMLSDGRSYDDLIKELKPE